ncbi:hypothetical protein ACFOLJ_17625 [Rugamonas sp. CCM 8940]|uniref:hypothetical protein n=1 Tax=Rugamonas sp. CCM 8940 TaxID=2765359 RepID=UPI0018F6FAF2|nr:hypothetical protein [Rugamonas sp. CCM 8940]MBJ7310932.1 hypothetical protein [Rugamonas sp. CCM 8940]
MDSTYAKWFDNGSVVVDVQLEDSDEFLSEEEIIMLTGAPKGSEILVVSKDGAIEFRVKNPMFVSDMVRRLISIDDTTYSYLLSNDALELKNEFSALGIGTRCVIREIFAAKKALEEYPIESIEVYAIGNYESFYSKDYPMRGYYVWATMGFDALIPMNVRPKLSQEFKDFLLISELVFTEKGREEWMKKGESVHLSFKTKSDSTSWALLERYMAEKEIEL